ncbi:uncharacterized protein LAJ45_02873 [Morchella importuna]|uniref:uncharacterized protein n=1 Tax=Morchella importuna TaxID=1174673 RepID=UPI001E8E23DA|nr:uncharacterized protein LAJ45_02873 [Morchella importuna]KAH8153286.1 hypothetical protein LAJ45_02873 [Morchella importuna]
MSDGLPQRWTPGEKRLCYCDLLDGLPHRVLRSVWFQHRRQQALRNEQEEPNAINSPSPQASNHIDIIQSQPDNQQALDLLLNSPVFIDRGIDDHGLSVGASPVFNDNMGPLLEDDRPMGNPPRRRGRSVRTIIQREPAPAMRRPLAPRDNGDHRDNISPPPSILRNESPQHNIQEHSQEPLEPNTCVQEEAESVRIMSQEHASTQLVVPDSQNSGIYNREWSITVDQAYGHGEEEVIQETQPDPAELSEDEATLDHMSPVDIYAAADNSADDPGSEPSSSDSSDVPGTPPTLPNHEMPDENLPNLDDEVESLHMWENDPDDSEDPDDSNDSIDEEDLEDSEDEDPQILTDFQYSAIPNITLSEPILKHITLMKVRMDGNVAMDTHKQYIRAVKDFVAISDEATARRELGLITEIHHVRYDVCRNNCLCFAEYPNATNCPICKADRLDAKGKPYKTFDYIPLIHRLLLMYSDSEYVRTSVAYKSSFPPANENERESTRDYWDSLLFSTLKSTRDIWTDHRDIGQYDVWPLLLVNLNIPPAERVLKKNLILCGIIPGPGNPKDISSFLRPLVDEFVTLQAGVKGWDGLRKEAFQLRAHIALISGDTMAMAKLMKWTGPNSYRYCKFCAIYGISEGHIYCPLEPPRDRAAVPEQEPSQGEPSSGQAQPGPSSNKRKRKPRAAKKSGHYPEKSWDPRTLPVWTDEEMRQTHKAVEDKNIAWGKLMGTNGEPIFSCLKSIVYPWCFTPDVMHLLDENTPRLYLAHWMGIYRDKETTALFKRQGMEDDRDFNNSQARSNANIDSQEHDELLQQGSQAGSQSHSQAIPRSQSDVQSQSQAGSLKQRLLRGRWVVSFNAAADDHSESYILPKKAWDRIGAEIADSRASIPTAFGKAFRDIKYHASYKATELMNFMHLISPIVLNQRLPAEYYEHWHHFVLATEKSRHYKLTMADIDEMEEDMIRVVTDYERLYYQYKTARISSCTTQVHGVLHLSTAMKVCGPNPIYHQYPMERTVCTIKAMCHSRSAANRNLSLQLLERERIKHLPFIAILPEGFNDMEDKRLFGFAEKDKVAYPVQYPDCLLMGPKEKRRLNQYERASLRQFIAEKLGVPVRAVDSTALLSDIMVLWGRAIAGRILNHASEYEVVGSKISNSKTGVATNRRNDSWVRYILSDENDNDTSYFGRVMHYLQYVVSEIPNSAELGRDGTGEPVHQEPEPYMLAYI